MKAAAGQAGYYEVLLCTTLKKGERVAQFNRPIDCQVNNSVLPFFGEL